MIFKIDSEKKKIDDGVIQSKEALHQHIKKTLAAVQFWEVVLNLVSSFSFFSI